MRRGVHIARDDGAGVVVLTTTSGSIVLSADEAVRVGRDLIAAAPKAAAGGWCVYALGKDSVELEIATPAGARVSYALMLPDALRIGKAMVAASRLAEFAPPLEIMELRARQIIKAMDDAIAKIPDGCRGIVIVSSDSFTTYASTMDRPLAINTMRELADKIEKGHLI